MDSISLTYLGAGSPKNGTRDLFVTGCIVAVAEGLSRFMRRPTRVALIFAESKSKPLCVYDPYNLLTGHVDFLKSHYAKYDWRMRGSVEYPTVPGLWHDGFHNTESTDYQRWFVEEGIDTARHINKRWCQEGARVIMHELPFRENMQSEAAFVGLRNFAPEAVAKYIDASMGQRRESSNTSRIMRIIADVSQRTEEGALPTGKILFVRHGAWVDPDILISDFDLSNLKQLRKVLTAVKSGPHHLIANERRVMGFGLQKIPKKSVVAHFGPNRTALIVNGTTVAEIHDGNFYAGIPEVDLAPIFSEVERLFGPVAYKIGDSISRTIASVASSRHGCSVVVTDNELPWIKFHRALDPASENDLSLIRDMAAVDGALLMKCDGLIHAFGCLLDGNAIPSLEDSARGSRYNSAIRYTKSNSEALILTISEDGPITAFASGKPLTSSGEGLPPELPNSIRAPMTVQKWLKEKTHYQ